MKFYKLLLLETQSKYSKTLWRWVPNHFFYKIPVLSVCTIWCVHHKRCKWPPTSSWLTSERTKVPLLLNSIIPHVLPKCRRKAPGSRVERFVNHMLCSSKRNLENAKKPITVLAMTTLHLIGHSELLTILNCICLIIHINSSSTSTFTLKQHYVYNGYMSTSIHKNARMVGM